jgi:hypothetical protein
VVDVDWVVGFGGAGGTSGLGRAAGFAGIYEIAEFLAGFEERDALGRDIDLGTGFGVAAGAGVALPRAEAAEAADFDLVTGFESVDDGIEKSVNDNFAVATRKVTQGGDAVNEIGFGHRAVLLRVNFRTLGRD